MSHENLRIRPVRINEQLPEPPDPMRRVRERTLLSGEKVKLSTGAWIVLNRIEKGRGNKTIFDIAQSIRYADGNLPIALFNTFLVELGTKLKGTGTRVAGRGNEFDPKKKFLRVEIRKRKSAGKTNKKPDGSN